MSVSAKKEITPDEYFDLLDAIRAAEAAGDMEKLKELEKIERAIPLAPYSAAAVVQIYGKEYALANYDLSRADELFGEGWMEKVKEPFSYVLPKGQQKD